MLFALGVWETRIDPSVDLTTGEIKNVHLAIDQVPPGITGSVHVSLGDSTIRNGSSIDERLALRHLPVG